MLSELMNAVSVHKPAIVPDLEEHIERKDWEKSGFVINASIRFRTMAVFFITLPAVSGALRSIVPASKNPLLSRAALLALTTHKKHLNTIIQRFVPLATLPVNFYLSLFAALSVSLACYLIEAYRAKTAISAAFVKIFDQFRTLGNPIGPRTMPCWVEHPSAVQALIKFASEETDLKTSQPFNQQLLEYTIKNLSSDSTNRLKSFKLIIDYFSASNCKITDDSFHAMLQHTTPDFALYALQKEVVAIDIDAAKCWRFVQDEKIADHLAKQFPRTINKVEIMSSSKTRLLHELALLAGSNDATSSHKLKSNIYMLLKHGAFITDPKDLKESINGTSLEEWLLQNHPKILKALEQAQKASLGTGWIEESTLNTTNSLFDLLGAPVEINNQEGLALNNKNILLRTVGIALTAFSIIAAITLAKAKSHYGLALTTSLILIPTLLIAKVYSMYQRRKGTNMLNDCAVQLFTKCPFPNPGVMKYIAHENPSIIDTLIANKADLNKQDSTGKTLLDTLFSKQFMSGPIPEAYSSFFIKVATPLFDSSIPKHEKFASFLEILPHSKYAECLFTSGLFKATDLTDEQQFNCWVSCQSPEELQVLFKGGFDIEVKNSEDHTPLLYIAAKKQERKSDCIKALIEYGANLEATAKTGQNIMDLLDPNSDKELLEYCRGVGTRLSLVKVRS